MRTGGLSADGRRRPWRPDLDLISWICDEFMKGTLSLQGDKVEVIFGNESIELESDYSFSGRGMELSVTDSSLLPYYRVDQFCLVSFSIS